MAIENDIQAIQSAQTTLDQIVNAPDVTLFTTETQNDNSVRVMLRVQLNDERLLPVLLNIAKSAVDSITVDDIRGEVMRQAKQYIWDKAQAALPLAGDHKTTIDNVIAQYENDPDIDKGVV